MIVETLQKKFIAASMLAVTILLMTLIGAINILNYVNISGRQERMLEMLCELDGMPEDHMHRRDSERLQDPMGRTEPQGRRFSMDEAMAARFFTAWIDENGEVLRTDVSRIYAVDAEGAAGKAKEILAAGKESGTWNGFRFLVRDCSSQQTDASLILVAMDTTGDRKSLLSVLGISAGIAAICWLIMLIPVHALARRAIAPTAMSIERQKQFVTNAGHELKTPLAIIQANTEALELYNGENKWTRNIRTQTIRLSTLMQNLLTLSKMDESSLKLEMQSFDLGPLVRETWEHFAESAAVRKLSLDTELSDIRQAVVMANRDSISQLFSILFDNAVKYTPKGGSIGMLISQENDTVLFEQYNTVEMPAADRHPDGENISEDPERLFERFYRADSDRSRKKGGYGIGLSAARAIAGANGGTIRARREDDRIVFTVRLKAYK